ncbi:MAG: autotransporter assembly complex family protein [Rickettsiaceae bacterium]
MIVCCSRAYAGTRQQLNFIINLEPKLSIKKDLDNLAKDIIKNANLYNTTNQKNYWAIEAKKLFTKLLYSYGYYECLVEEVSDSPDVGDVVFNIVAGDRYKIGEILILHNEHSNKNITLPTLDNIKISPGDVVLAQDIDNAQQKISRFIERHNCLLSFSVSNQCILNSVKKDVSITFLVNAGPTAVIESVDFIGLKSVKADYVKKLIKLNKGQCFKNSYIRDARGYLQKSGLFASTTPSIPTAVNKDGAVPVTFNLTERKFRSFKTGLNYSTYSSIGTVVGWEHRNLFGSGEKGNVDLSGNKKEQVLELSYIKPFFQRDDQKLRFNAKIENKKSKAFYSKGINSSILLERELSSKWQGGAGARLSYDNVDHTSQSKTKRQYYLVSMPFFLTYDTRNNILNPRKGYYLNFDLAPFLQINKDNTSFVKNQISATTYCSNNKVKLRPTLALKAAIGSILGVDSIKVPMTERFYVGGSSSVRGYANQLVGSLDKNNKTIGGRSFVETSAEIRLKLSKSMQLVSFVDSGFVYNKQTPNLNKKLLHGVGFGIRYATNFGPIRFDIGFPTKRRKSVDQAFQLYFGIGQAF